RHNLSANPQFVRSPSVGADGIWGTIDDDYGDLRLQPTSPCIDFGYNTYVPAGVTTDAGGNARLIDIPGVRNPGAIVDFGAYETQPVLAALAGGPYFVPQNQTLTLHGLGSSDLPGALQYAWEWDGDGLFDDGVGPNPVFASAGLASLTT